MEPILFIAIISILFLYLLYRLNSKIKRLVEYKKNTAIISDCISKPQSMLINSGSKFTGKLNSITCIQGSRFKDVVDKYRLGQKAFPIQKCIEDNVNFRLMVNAYGEQVCLSTQESNDMINDFAISNLAKDCLVDANGLPDVNKSFVVDNEGIVGCIETRDLVNNYLNSISTSTPLSTPTGTVIATPLSTPTGTVIATPTGTPTGTPI